MGGSFSTLQFRLNKQLGGILNFLTSSHSFIRPLTAGSMLGLLLALGGFFSHGCDV